MLRLEGISFFTEDGPVRQGFLRCRDLTVLTGRNDTGKTRLLELIAAALNRPEECEFIDLFGTMSESEVAELIDSVAADECEIDQYVAEYLDGFPATLEPADAADRVRVGIRLHTGVFSAWRYGRAPAVLGAALSERLLERVRWTIHSGDPDEPVKLGYLGAASRWALPEATVVPSTPDVLAREVGLAVLRLSRALQELALRWRVLYDRDSQLEGLDASFIHGLPGPEAVGGLPSWHWLVEEQEHATVVHPAAIFACAGLQRIAAGLLPEFIGERYRLEVWPAQPSEIVTGDPVRLGLLTLYPPPEGEDPADWDEDELALRFSLDEAPGGFVVWLQLAIYEAVARTRSVSHVLERCARTVGDVHAAQVLADLELPDADLDLLEQQAEDEADQEPDDDADEEPEDDDERRERLAQVPRICREALRYLREPTPMAPAGLDAHESGDTAALAGFDEPEVADFFGAPPGRRMYLVDEPEQRLHPALQRRAARWLRTAMGQWDAQCVVATHALAFIDLPDARIYELARDGMRSTIQPLDPAQLTPYTELARAIGFDRGELLARWRAFVLADRAVVAVLEELCADRLERGWVKLIATDLVGGPAGRGSGAAGLAELSILWQLTTAPVIVLAVSASPAEIGQLLGGDARERAEAAARSPELRALGEAVELAVRSEQRIEVLTLGQADVLELLDSEAIREVVGAGERRPYGPETVRAIAERMKVMERSPPQAVLDAVFEAERIAMAAETPVGGADDSGASRQAGEGDASGR
jgi:energy-coupling factor transporter ATP-binding protein EcfA2